MRNEQSNDLDHGRNRQSNGQSSYSRRSVLRRMVGGAVGAVAATSLTSCMAQAAPADNATPTDTALQAENDSAQLATQEGPWRVPFYG